jgi:hypothetical protein
MTSEELNGHVQSVLNDGVRICTAPLLVIADPTEFHCWSFLKTPVIEGSAA